MSRIYGPLTLPSGKVVKFREPLGADKANVMQMVTIGEDNLVNGAMMIDEYVSAKCITEVDGVASNGDYKALFDSWGQKDIMFYKRVFERLFGLAKDQQDAADKAADFLLGGLTSTDGANSPGSFTYPLTNG